MGSFFSRCWAARPTYTQLGQLLVRKQPMTTVGRAPNEDTTLTMTTFVAAGEVIALSDFGFDNKPLTSEDHKANLLMTDSVIERELWG